MRNSLRSCAGGSRQHMDHRKTLIILAVTRRRFLAAIEHLGCFAGTLVAMLCLWLPSRLLLRKLLLLPGTPVLPETDKALGNDGTGVMMLRKTNASDGARARKLIC